MEKLKNNTATMNLSVSLKICLLSFLLFAGIGIHALYAGGGWPQPKGHGFYKLTQWWVIADQHFTDSGLLDPNVTNGIFTTSIYAEYGFTDRITGIAYVPFFSRAYFNNTISGTTGETLIPGESINSLGDTDLGLKYGILTKGPIALAATVMVGIPLGTDDGGTQNNLQTGDGEFNQMLLLDAGTGFKVGKLNAYANATVGFNNRTNGYSDEFRFGIEGGITFLNDKLTTLVRLTGTQSFKNGDVTRGANSTSIFANNSEHLTISPEVSYKLSDKMGISAGLGKAISGQIIFANTAYNVGIWLQI